MTPPVGALVHNPSGFAALRHRTRMAIAPVTDMYPIISGDYLVGFDDQPTGTEFQVTGDLIVGFDANGGYRAIQNAAKTLWVQTETF